MKQFKVRLVTRGGNCAHYISAENYEEAVKKANEKWRGCVKEVEQ